MDYYYHEFEKLQEDFHEVMHDYPLFKEDIDKIYDVDIKEINELLEKNDEFYLKKAIRKLEDVIDYVKDTSTNIDKEYDEDDQIIFEGQIKDGIRIQGKEYQDNEIIYEGNYKDDLRWNGKGIEYDRENQVIFEGEYKEGKYWKGKENYYNSCGVLLYKREYNNGMIIKEIEYNIKGKKIFEGEYRNNEKYKGKEYNEFGEIIFEGEYNNNERFEGKAKNNLFDFTYINGKINSKNISVYDYHIYYISNKIIYIINLCNRYFCFI